MWWRGPQEKPGNSALEVKSLLTYGSGLSFSALVGSTFCLTAYMIPDNSMHIAVVVFQLKLMASFFKFFKLTF